MGLRSTCVNKASLSAQYIVFMHAREATGKIVTFSAYLTHNDHIREGNTRSQPRESVTRRPAVAVVPEIGERGARECRRAPQSACKEAFGDSQIEQRPTHVRGIPRS